LLVGACGSQADHKVDTKLSAETARTGSDVPVPLTSDTSGGRRGGNLGASLPILERAPPVLRGPKIIHGTGNFLRPDETGCRGVEITGPDEIRFNFANADIREVIDSILGDTLGVNYAIDPTVQGTITARTARPLQRSNIINALESVFGLAGAALT
jgi:general secretion pathway protein D